MEELKEITVKTLPFWDDHDDYPELTFVLNDSKPWCESCGQVDYGTPVCMTFTSWCLNCISSDADIISKEDTKKIWDASEKYFGEMEFKLEEDVEKNELDDSTNESFFGFRSNGITKEEFIDWFRKEAIKIEPETEDYYEAFSLKISVNQLDELYDLIKK